MHRTYAQDRRAFLKSGCASLFAGRLIANAAPGWRKQIGLELYTVRDLLAKDFEGTLAQVAEIGYTEVEPTSYGGLDPKAFRALLDRYKLTAPSTHTSATEGPDLERQLEGHRTMGFKYTQIRGGGRPAREEQTAASVERIAEQYNRHGAIAARFGMKVLIHNHGREFDPVDDTGRTQYDILLARTDPKVVAMQIDIGWAAIAGKNVLEMFEKHPGRFELWHVKDVRGLKGIDTSLRPGERRATFVPVGQGEIDYRKIFAAAARAGLKHFVIEQDNAGQNGADSLAAARANFTGLVKTLS